VFLRPVSLIAIWLWSRSGVIGYIFLSVVAMIVGPKMSLAGVSGIVILVALIWQKWRYMSWGISSCAKVPAEEVSDA
jgi:hypothetical protein